MNDSDPDLDKGIEIEEVNIALRKAKNSKSAGVDGCINEILKSGGEAMGRSLLVLFQKVWKSESVPIDWARGIIVPLFKDGE